MAQVEIMYPIEDQLIEPVARGIFFASGFADMNEEKQVKGLLTVVDPDGVEHPFEKDSIIIFPRFRRNGEEFDKWTRWLMKFDVSSLSRDVLMAATLTVDGERSREADPRNFQIRVPRDPVGEQVQSDPCKLITIDASIPPNSSVPAEAFVAYGTMTHPVVSVTMNQVAADFVYQDPDADTWAAQFATLVATTYYELRALDDQDHLAVAHNLLAVDSVLTDARRRERSPR